MNAKELTQWLLKTRAARRIMVLGLTVLSVVASLILLQDMVLEVHATSPGLRESSKTLQLQHSSAETLLVATNAEFPPMEYISGTQIVGHDIDLMDTLAAEMGATVVYSNVKFSEILTVVVEGKVDAAISTLTVSPGREELVDFTLPYLNLGDEAIAIALQQGDDALRGEMNTALRQLRAQGYLELFAAAVAADKPTWGARVPEWPYTYIPLLFRESD